MKRILVTLFLSASFGMNAQTNVYHHFPGTNSGAFWRVDYGDNNFCYALDAVYQYAYGSDTLIGSYTYHQLMRTGAVYHICYGGIFGYVGAVREDSIAKKIFIVLPNQVNDTVLFDFSLQIGDTLHCVQNDMYSLNDMVVTSIDSILVGSEYRKEWNFTSSLYNLPIVEGIGSLSGLMEPLGSFEEGGMLICYTDSNVHFDSPFGWSPFGCDTVFQGIKFIDARSPLNIFPSPANDILHIEFSSFDPGTIFITNAFGRTIREIEVEKQTELNIAELPNGIYFIRSAANEFLPVKFVVLH